MKNIFFIINLIIVYALTGCSIDGPRTIEQSYPYTDTANIDFDIDLNIEHIESRYKDIVIIPDDFVGKIVPNDNIEFTSGLLINIKDKEAYYAKDVNKKIYPASITKILTALVVLDYGNLDEKVIIQHDFENLIYNAKRSGIKKGDIFTLEQLLYGLLINSGNDCAIAIAEHIAGSVEEFAELMNNKAKSLGTTSSNFTNPHGLHNVEHFSTPYDLYLIFNEALKNSLIKDIINLKEYRVVYSDVNNNEYSQVWYNTNLFLRDDSYNIYEDIVVWGGKTGYISESGNNLIILSYINDEPFIALIIGVETKDNLYKNLLYLMKLALDGM